MTTPAQVLDEQISLLAYSQNARYQEYLKGYLKDVWDKQPSHWSNATPEARAARLREYSEMIPLALKAAYAYHVSDDMLSLANWAGHGLPQDVTFDPEMLPTQVGFLMFERGMLIPEVWGRETYIHALMWQHGRVTSQGKPGVRLTGFVDINDRRDEVNQIIWKDGTAPKIIAQCGHLQLSLSVEIGYDDPQPSEEVIDQAYIERSLEIEKDSKFGPAWSTTDGLTPIKVADNWLRTIIAIFELMNQTITDVHEEEPDRAGRKRARRMGLPDRVTVIHLRRTDSARHEGESDVEWQHRWIVRGHWRNQPIGPRSAEEQEYKRIWINPFTKGPDGAPLIVTDKVYTLNR